MNLIEYDLVCQSKFLPACLGKISIQHTIRYKTVRQLRSPLQLLQKTPLKHPQALYISAFPENFSTDAILRHVDWHSSLNTGGKYDCKLRKYMDL